MARRRIVAVVSSPGGHAILSASNKDDCILIGATVYSGDHPKAVELKAQAKRVHANYVIYSLKGVDAKPGSRHFSIGQGFGSGGSDSGHYNVRIAFLGRQTPAN